MERGESKKGKKNTVKVIIIVLIIALAAVAAWRFISPGPANISAKVPALFQSTSQPVIAQLSAAGDVQTVNLSFGKWNYNPEVIIAKQGVPLQITGDLNRLQGCYRSFEIPQLGVQKLFKDGDNVLEFTPQKTGTYGYQCFMGMGTGKLIVE